MNKRLKWNRKQFYSPCIIQKRLKSDRSMLFLKNLRDRWNNAKLGFVELQTVLSFQHPSFYKDRILTCHRCKIQSCPSLSVTCLFNLWIHTGFFSTDAAQRRIFWQHPRYCKNKEDAVNFSSLQLSFSSLIAFFSKHFLIF